MQITLNQQDQYLEILPEGRIDAVTAGEVDSKCQDALKDSVGGVVLNFSAVPYISSAGLRSVLKLAKSAQAAKRQLICFGGGAAIGIPAYLLSKGPLGSTGAMFLMLAVMLPAFLLAMYERDGLPFEKVVGNIIRAKFLRPGVRPYQTQNIYAPFTGKEEPIAENKKTQAQPRKK